MLQNTTAHGPTTVTTSISSEKRYLPQHTKTMAEILLQSPSQAPTTNCTWRDQLECGYLETLPGVQEYVPHKWDQGAMKSRLGSEATEEIAVKLFVQRSHHLLYTSQKKSQISKSSRPSRGSWFTKPATAAGKSLHSILPHTTAHSPQIHQHLKDS